MIARLLDALYTPVFIDIDDLSFMCELFVSFTV